MARLNIDKQNKLEPVRIDSAIKRIEKLGYVICHRDSNCIQFMFSGKIVTFYPYSGWHTGKTIKDGRGIEKLLKQIK